MAVTSSRNKNAGHGYERVCKDLFIEAGFPNVITTRLGSRARDNQGIDLMNDNEHAIGRLPYNVQCKNMTERVDYHTLLENMPVLPGVTNVVLHKYTGRSKSTKSKGLLFKVRGTYAIMPQGDFFAMVKELERLKKVESELRKMEEHFLGGEQ